MVGHHRSERAGRVRRRVLDGARGAARRRRPDVQAGVRAAGRFRGRKPRGGSRSSAGAGPIAGWSSSLHGAADLRRAASPCAPATMPATTQGSRPSDRRTRGTPRTGLKASAQAPQYGRPRAVVRPAGATRANSATWARARGGRVRATTRWRSGTTGRSSCPRRFPTSRWTSSSSPRRATARTRLQRETTREYARSREPRRNDVPSRAPAAVESPPAIELDRPLSPACAH